MPTVKIRDFEVYTEDLTELGKLRIDALEFIWQRLRHIEKETEVTLAARRQIAADLKRRLDSK
jgi:hypothetical protein